MSELDAQTLNDLTAALAHNFARLYTPQPAAGMEQRLVSALAPGVVAFASRLAAALPDDYDLRPALARFFANPAVAAALQGYGDDAAARQLAVALQEAGIGTSWLAPPDFDEALGAFVAAVTESGRREGGAPGAISAGVAVYLEAANRPVPGTMRRRIAELLDGLATGGLSAVIGSQIVGADGYTILFDWRPPRAARDELAATSSPPEERQETAGAEPPTSQPWVVPLRLDAAAPPQVSVGRPFDLAVAIRRQGAPPLSPEDLTHRESSDFGVIWPAGTPFLSLRVQVSAPECDLFGGDSRPVRLLAGQDGPTVYFQLAPRVEGPLSVIITVYQEADWIGSARVRTQAAAVAGPVARGGLAMTLESKPLGDSEVNRKALSDALDHGYSDGELRDLCFELDVDYEDLPGDGQAAKARELVLYARRRGLLAGLVERVMRDRPGLLVPA